MYMFSFLAVGDKNGGGGVDLHMYVDLCPYEDSYHY